MKSAFQNLGKERRDDAPGVKLGMGNAMANPARPNQLQNFEGNSRGAIAANFRGLNDSNIRGDDRPNFRGGSPNNFRGSHTRVPCFELNTYDWNKLSADAFRDFMRQEDLTIKELAQLIGCNDRTAENYVSGRNSPRDLHFLRALAAIPTFEALVRKVAALAGDIDPMQVYRATKLAQAAGEFLMSIGVQDDSSDFAGEERDLLTGDLFEGRA